MKAILVRVGIGLSQKSGIWNAPVNPNTGEFAYVPILEGRIDTLIAKLRGMENKTDKETRLLRQANEAKTLKKL